MADMCVNCGHVVIVDDWGVLVHADGKLGAPQMCPDDSKRIACLPQGGVE